MQLYKAFLDNQYQVTSFEKPKEIETIFSKNDEPFEVNETVIQDYIGIQGHIILYKSTEETEGYVMFLNINHGFNNLWDIHAINVAEQIRKKIREQLYSSVKDRNSAKVYEYIQHYPGIIGEKEIELDDTTYLYHQDNGGVWASANPTVLWIDKETGLIKGKCVGKSNITYKVKTKGGELTCFFTVEVKAKLIRI
jgi:hypothetical protein